MVNYKEDSTRGSNPRIDPKSYKPDVLIQVWVESRKLVMLNQWLDKHLVTTRFMSDIVKNVLDIVLDQLLEVGEVDKVEFNQMARDMLKARYNKDHLNPGNRGRRNILHNLHLDNIRQGSLLKASDDKVINGIARPEQVQSKISEEEWTRVMSKIEEDKKKELKERISELEFDEQGRSILKGPNKSNYTEIDRVKDLKEKERQDAKRLLNTIEQSSDKVHEGIKPKVHSKNDAPRKLTEEELKAKEQRLRDKDRAEQDAWASAIPQGIKSID